MRAFATEVRYSRLLRGRAIGFLRHFSFGRTKPKNSRFSVVERRPVYHCEHSGLQRESIAGLSSHLLQPARPCLIFRHHRPVVLAFAMRNHTDQTIAPDIATR